MFSENFPAFDWLYLICIGFLGFYVTYVLIGHLPAIYARYVICGDSVISITAEIEHHELNFNHCSVSTFIFNSAALYCIKNLRRTWSTPTLLCQ